MMGDDFDDFDDYGDFDDFDDCEVGAGLFVGWCVTRRDRAPIQQLQDLLGSLKRDLPGLDVFTAGTADDIHDAIIVGRSAVVVEANDSDPAPISPTKVDEAMAKLPPHDAAFWRRTLAAHDGLVSSDAPGVYLTSWGPLCCGAVTAGVATTRGSETVYNYVANQSMRQTRSSTGVDGKTLDSCEGSEVKPVELRAARLEEVDKLSAPQFWLTCRYD